MAAYKYAQPAYRKILSHQGFYHDSTPGNLIAASTGYVAMVSGPLNVNIQVYDLENIGRRGPKKIIERAQDSFITDVAFSPFRQDIFATTGNDKKIKMWDVDGELYDILDSPTHIFTARWHPAADHLIACAGAKVQLWDVNRGRCIYTLQKGFKNLEWCPSGRLLAGCNVERRCVAIDPRSNTEIQLATEQPTSRVAWVSDRLLLCSGFDTQKKRELKLLDLSNLSSKKLEQNLGTTGDIFLFVDVDTGMVFLCGKGDCAISRIEVSAHSPHFILRGKMDGLSPTLAACMLPKRALDVGKAEINRILQLTAKNLGAISYSIPRQVVREFYEEIYPETAGSIPACSAEEWWSGNDTPMAKVSFNISKNETFNEPRPAQDDPMPSTSGSAAPYLQVPGMDDDDGSSDSSVSSIGSSISSNRDKNLQLHTMPYVIILMSGRYEVVPTQWVQPNNNLIFFDDAERVKRWSVDHRTAKPSELIEYEFMEGSAISYSSAIKFRDALNAVQPDAEAVFTRLQEIGAAMQQAAEKTAGAADKIAKALPQPSKWSKGQLKLNELDDFDQKLMADQKIVDALETRIKSIVPLHNTLKKQLRACFKELYSSEVIEKLYAKNSTTAGAVFFQYLSSYKILEKIVMEHHNMDRARKAEKDAFRREAAKVLSEMRRPSRN